MLDGSHGARVPRPVAGVPPPALADGAVVAKAWLLELLAAAPLSDAGAVPVAELAERGPQLCAEVLEAVGSAAGLERLAPGGDRAALASSAAELAGARDPAAAAAAVAALRRALWASLPDAATSTTNDARATAALAERVAHVADVVTAAVLARPLRRGTPAGVPAGHRSPAADASAGGLARDRSPAAAPPGALARDRSPAAAPPGALARDRSPAAASPPAGPVASDLASAEEPWREPVERCLAAHRRDGAPFGLLVVEAADAERLLAAGGADAAALEAVEPALRGAVRPGDAVVRERAGRLWVLAPGVGGDGARALAEHVAEGVAVAAAPHGIPLEAAVGVAACPADGDEAGALAACADERLFAAQAAGVPVV
jgi:GGDEF domain-containing protein